MAVRNKARSETDLALRVETNVNTTSPVLGGTSIRER